MVKLFSKGDLYSNIAKVSILLLLCTIARVVKGKERISFIVHASTNYKPTVIISVFSLFLLSRFMEIWAQLACEYESLVSLVYV